MGKENNRLVVVLGAGISLGEIDQSATVVKPGSDISGNFEAAVLYGHGNVSHIGDAMETATISLIDGKETTIDNILFVQEKTPAKDLHVLSCHSGSAVNNIKQNSGSIEDGTTITIFSSAKHPALAADCNDYLYQISKNYSTDQKIDPVLFLAKIAAHNPQTAIFCSVKKDENNAFAKLLPPGLELGKQNKVLAVKIVSPKNASDMSDIKKYLKSGKAIEIIGDFNQDDPDHIALQKKMQEELNKEVDRLSPEDIQQYKNKACIQAMSKNKTQRAKDWLENGADVNGVLNDGVTTLYASCSSGNKDIAEILIKNKVDINKGLYNSFTPLMVAALQGHKDVVKLLLDEMSVEQICKTCNENKAIEFCQKNNIEMPQDHKDLLGKSAFGMAIKNGHFELAEMIENAMIDKLKGQRVSRTLENTSVERFSVSHGMDSRATS